MTLIETLHKRHAVRHYDNKPLKAKDKKKLLGIIKQINKKAKLHFQLITNEPKAFSGPKAKICNFTGCVNYFVLVGPKTKDLKYKCGYYGQELVLKAQQMGLNTCWVLLTYNKIKNTYVVRKNEKLVCVIALGYGTTQGHPHQSKTINDVVVNKGNLPQWFKNKVKLALLAPTGGNQQGFKIELKNNNKVVISNKSLCGDIDLGIVEYCFNLK